MSRRHPRRTIQLPASVTLQIWVCTEQGPPAPWRFLWCQVLLLLATLECAIQRRSCATLESRYPGQITREFQKNLPSNLQYSLACSLCRRIYWSRRLGVDHQISLETDYGIIPRTGHFSSVEKVFSFRPLLKALAACFPVLPWHFLVPGNHRCL